MKLNKKILTGLAEATAQIIPCSLEHFDPFASSELLDEIISDWLDAIEIKELNIDILPYLKKHRPSNEKKYLKELESVSLWYYPNSDFTLVFKGTALGCAYIANLLYGSLSEIDYEDLVITCEEFASKNNAKKIANALQLIVKKTNKK